MDCQSMTWAGVRGLTDCGTQASHEASNAWFQLTIHGIESRAGLSADSSEPAGDSLPPSLSALPPLVHALSVSQNK